MRDIKSAPLILRSPGKINLFLHVTGQRNDGYHLLETVFQFLKFSDTLKFEVVDGHEVNRIDDHPFNLPDDDLISQAASLLRSKYTIRKPPGINITLSKIIPPGAGMGGGSSNAATTMIALNQLWNLGLTREDLLPLAAQLGADVPVFIYGKSCWATGIGDSLEHFKPQENWYCLCIPSDSVSTAEIFSHPDLVRDHLAISKTDFYQSNTSNDLEPITRKLHPQVDEALNELSKYGPARMNGSGSSVFLRCETEQRANEIKRKLRSTLNCYVTYSANEIIQL